MRIQIIIFYTIFGSYISANSCDSLIKQADLLKIYTESTQKDTLQSYSNKLKVCYEQKGDLTGLIFTYKIRARYERVNIEDKSKVLDTLIKLPIFQKPKIQKERTAVVGAYISLASYQRKISQYELAKKNYETALHLYQKYKIDPKEYNIAEYCLKPLANIYTRYGDNEKAKNLIRKAIGIANEINDKPYRIAAHYANFGICFWNESKYKKAIDIYNKGLAIDHKYNEIKAHLFISKAESQFELYLVNNSLSTNQEVILVGYENLLNKAIENLEIALQLSADSTILIDINNLFAKITMSQGAAKSASKYAVTALTLAKSQYTKNAREIGKAYNTVGHIKIAAQQYSIAIQYFDSTLTTVLPNFKPDNMFDLPEANQFYKENTIYEALDGKADALQKLYEIEKDERFLETALNCHELALNAELHLRKVYEYESSKLNLQKYTKKRTGKAIAIAYQLYSLSGKTAYINRAFQLAESSRSVLLLEGIVKNYVSRQLFKEDSLFYKQQNFERTKQSLATNLNIENDSITTKNLQQQFDFIDAKLKEVNQLIESRHPNYKSIINQTKKQVSLNQLDNILRQNETLVEYFQADSILYAFKIEPNSTPEFYKLKPNLFQLNELLEILRNPDHSKKAISLFKHSANQLYQDIIAPLNIPIGKKLTIIPDGKLNFLPFEVLVTQPSDENTSFKKLAYLLKEHIINYQYSATIFAKLQQQSNQPKMKKILSVAPVFENTDYALNASIEEVNEISNIFSTDAFMKELATKENILDKINQYHILHFSSHASSGDQLAKQQAHIALYNDTLYLNEIYQQAINANLTVLSACETNTGKYEGGEGVMSLSRAFAYAGCPSLVSTLWQVNDQSTKHIVVEFYQNLKEGSTKDKALQQAKLTYLKMNDDVHPFYWGSLVLIGNTQPLESIQDFHYLYCFLLVLLFLGGGYLSYKLLKRKL